MLCNQAENTSAPDTAEQYQGTRPYMPVISAALLLLVFLLRLPDSNTSYMLL